MTVRGHDPFIIETFNGLWDRGDDASCPADHLTVANNVQYFESGVETRNPLTKWQNPAGLPLGNIKRVFNYVMQDGQSLLVLTSGGTIYHLIGPNIQHGPILTIPAMTDFNMVSIAGRAYITPFTTYTDVSGQTYQLGLKDEYVYVYGGDGTPARKTGGPTPTNGGLKSFLAFNDTGEGRVSKGIHLILIGFTDASITPVVRMIEAPGDRKVQLTHLPKGPDGTISRMVSMTKVIDPKELVDGRMYTYYHALPIFDNTTESIKLDVSDEELTVPAVWTSNWFSYELLVINAPIPGYCDLGFHLVGVVFETDTGFLSAPGPEYFAGNTFINVTQKVQFYNIPTTTDPTVKKRHLVSTKAIFDYNGDQKGYQFFFIPDGVINDTTITTAKAVSYYDSDLVSDASHLFDNYGPIPAGVNLTTYHSRLVVVGISTIPDLVVGPHETKRLDNRSVALVSAAGEPEAISKVDGLIITPLDGSPLTHCQEFRDILYLFKKTRTYAYVDNQDEPSTWIEEVLDQGVGAPVHGIATVLDSGGVNTDFLLITDWSGLMLFNGTYSRPELSFKIDDFWATLIRNNFHQLQIANDSIGKKVYITLPDPLRNILLYADYNNGMDAKSIRWAKWIFDAKMTSACLIETNKLILGADE